MSQLRFSGDHPSRYTRTELETMTLMTTDLLHALTRHLRQISIPPHLPLHTPTINIHLRLPPTSQDPIRIPLLISALSQNCTLLHQFAEPLLELWRATIQPSIESHLADYFRLWRLSLAKGDLVESLQLENDIHAFITERLQRLSWEFHRLRRRIGSDSGNEELSEKSREERKVLKYLRDRMEREVIPEAWAIMETIGECALLGLGPALDKAVAEEEASHVTAVEEKRSSGGKKRMVRVNSKELEIEERCFRKEEGLEAINRKLAKRNNRMIQDMLSDLTGEERERGLRRTDTGGTNASVESLFDKWKSLPPVPEDEEGNPRIVVSNEGSPRKTAAGGMVEWNEERSAKGRVGRTAAKETGLRIKTREDDGYLSNNEIGSVSSRSNSRSPGLNDGLAGLKIYGLDLGESFDGLKISTGINTSFENLEKPPPSPSPRPWRSMQKQFETESALSSFNSAKSFGFNRSYSFGKPLSPVDSISTVDSVDKLDADATPRPPARFASYDTPPAPLRINKDLPIPTAEQTSTPPLTPPSSCFSSSPPQYETPRPLRLATQSRIEALTAFVEPTSSSPQLPIMPMQTPTPTPTLDSSPPPPPTQLHVPLVTVQQPTPSKNVSGNKTYVPFEITTAEALEQKSRLRPIPARLLWERKSDENIEGRKDGAKKPVGAGRVRALASKWENDVGGSSSPKSGGSV
ncbi:hypothetical protein BJ508DRAFT_345080 [Ascobolus immersus RN42]|uniref:Uncharacterized protein n=1 Tax=Ascobolus immersus RN42 TaxID=1160509 RepID=A0A3N4ISU5_ASCIM|nr:hypothetical protein BJ508DRAFT_345080 [Ascobolus immersus RN42]